MLLDNAPVTTGRRCNQQVGQHSDHVHTCAQGPGMRRHNKIRDAWIDVCRAAGWHTQVEQLVFINASVCKRADIVALSPKVPNMHAMSWSRPPPAQLNHMPTFASHGDGQSRSVLNGFDGESVMRMLPSSLSCMVPYIIGCRQTPCSSYIESSWR